MEGRPPSGLIKSITSSLLDLARDSPARSPFPLTLLGRSRSFSLTLNSRNCSFFPFAAPRLTIVRAPSPISLLVAVPSWSVSRRVRLFTLILRSFYLPRLTRVYRENRFFLFCLPCYPAASLASSFSSSCLARPIFSFSHSFSSSASPLNNCEPAALLFLLPAAPHSTKGC